MKIFALPENVGNALLQYLSKRPYEEVFQLVGALSALREIEAGPVEVPPVAVDPKKLATKAK